MSRSESHWWEAIALARELLDRGDVLPGCSRLHVCSRLCAYCCSRLCAWACAAGGGPELPATVRHGCRGDLSRLPWVCCVDDVVGCCVAGDPKAVGSVSDEGMVLPCSSDQGTWNGNVCFPGRWIYSAAIMLGRLDRALCPVVCAERAGNFQGFVFVVTSV